MACSRISCKNTLRRQAIPILYTRGTNYDIGFDMGRTFASMIKNFLEMSGPLNDTYLPLYNTPKGKQIYNETLECVKKSFPQYVRELEGVADGAKVEFHKLFLLHMDDITPQSLENQNATNSKIGSTKRCQQPVGCTSILLNGKGNRVLGHTEDALTETMNHYYFVVAHVINEQPQGKYNVKEERFMSLCYAGHLPGYTMNYNHHGLVFSINTLSASALKAGKTPRHFLTRAMLSAENYDDVITILKDTNVGAGDGCSINMTFLKDKSKMCYNIEMAPTLDQPSESRLCIKEIPVGQHSYHCNRYERIKIEEANNVMLDSSASRMSTLSRLPPPESKKDVENMLGDCTGGKHCVFRENNSLSEEVKTICLGIFDLDAKTYTLYSDNPRNNEPHVTIPLFLKE